MYRSHVLVCGGTGCTSSGSQQIMVRLREELKNQGLEEEVAVVQTGCHGLCALGPIMIIYPDATFYAMVKEDDIPEIVSEHLLKGRPVQRLLYDEDVYKRQGILRTVAFSYLFTPAPKYSETAYPPHLSGGPNLADSIKGRNTG